jgi:RimJ/RimL family protein N-acetyltransferase
VSAPEAVLQTPRLVLRRWGTGDIDGFAALNDDPAVMEFRWTRQQSEGFIRMAEAEWEERGLGLFCVEAPDIAEGCIGFIGLHVPGFTAAFTPAVEIGWRLARRAWGHGLATEGATAVRAFAHRECGLAEIVSFTAAINLRSQRVMEKIGLVRDPDGDFDHPRLAADDPLRPHVLYRGSAPRR